MKERKKKQYHVGFFIRLYLGTLYVFVPVLGGISIVKAHQMEIACIKISIYFTVSVCPCTSSDHIIELRTLHSESSVLSYSGCFVDQRIGCP